MKDEIVVCMRVEEGKLPFVELSYKDVCAECGSYVWVSPATKQFVDSGRFSRNFVCIECAMELLPK